MNLRDGLPLAPAATSAAPPAGTPRSPVPHGAPNGAPARRLRDRLAAVAPAVGDDAYPRYGDTGHSGEREHGCTTARSPLWQVE